MKKRSMWLGIGTIALVLVAGLIFYVKEFRSGLNGQQIAQKPTQQAGNPVDESKVPPAPSKQPPPTQPAAAPHSETGSFAIRGLIEGFYGSPWTTAQRDDMLHFMGGHHFNTYVYAPKDDPYQRLQWGDLYPSSDLEQMRGLVKTAANNGISFVYSISPGIPEPLPSKTADPRWEATSITFTSQFDRDRIAAKIDQLRSIGIHTFLLSFDDVEKRLKRADQKSYGSNYGQAHIDLANQLLKEEKQKDSAFQMWLAPTMYYGLKDNTYWSAIRSSLSPSIQVIWTGKWVLNVSIDSGQADQVANLLGRKPLLWDNYPVNDWTYAVNNAPQLLLGPLENRAPELGDHVSGMMANPMIQPEASKVALSTIGDYLHDSHSYQPQAAWQKAIQTLDGLGDPAAFQKFCSYSEESSFRDTSNPAFVAMTDAFWKERAAGRDETQTIQLQHELQEVAALPVRLHSIMHNTAMLSEIDPWLTKLGQEGEAGVLALDYLKSSATNPRHIQLRKEIQSRLNQIKGNNLYIGNEIVSFLEQVLTH